MILLFANFDARMVTRINHSTLQFLQHLLGQLIKYFLDIQPSLGRTFHKQGSILFGKCCTF